MRCTDFNILQLRTAEEWIVPVEIQARSDPPAARVPGGRGAAQVDYAADAHGTSNPPVD